MVENQNVEDWQVNPNSLSSTKVGRASSRQIQPIERDKNTI